jgi:heat shock protein HslJ
MRTVLSLIAVALCAACIAKPAPSELTGTSWQLVRIMSMDDSTDVPDDGANYTLAFGSDGHAALQTACNRGGGTWISEAPGRLTFGTILVTGMLCPQDSMSRKYLAQFEWVRSYVIEDGHLFLATMADGSIVEFAPAGPE